MTKPNAEEQLRTLRWAIEHTTDFALAVDGGANVGDWSAVMAEHFHEVHAFEPAPDVFDTLVKRRLKNVKCHEAALWDRESLIDMHETEKKRGLHRSRFAKEGASVPALALDSLHFDRCGLIKLDLEGGENLALRGAIRTLRHFHPTVVIEVDRYAKRYGFSQEDSTEFLQEIGYRQAYAFGPDKVFLFDR